MFPVTVNNLSCYKGGGCYICFLLQLIIDHVVIKEEAVTCVSWNFKENILAACTDDTRHRSVSSIL